MSKRGTLPERIIIITYDIKWSMHLWPESLREQNKGGGTHGSRCLNWGSYYFK